MASPDLQADIHSTAESWACSGPCNSFTALMNAENSRSAICICSSQIELENDSFVFIGFSFVSAMPGTRSGAFIPRCTRFLMTQMACTSVITPEV